MAKTECDINSETEINVAIEDLNNQSNQYE